MAQAPPHTNSPSRHNLVRFLHPAPLFILQASPLAQALPHTHISSPRALSQTNTLQPTGSALGPGPAPRSSVQVPLLAAPPALACAAGAGPTCSASRNWTSSACCSSRCWLRRRSSSSCSRRSACRCASCSSSSSCSFRSFSSCNCCSRSSSSSLAVRRRSRCSRCSRRFCFRSLCSDVFPSACSRIAVWMAAEGEGGGQ